MTRLADDTDLPNPNPSPPPIPFLDTLHNFFVDASWCFALLFLVVAGLHALAYRLGANYEHRAWFFAYFATGGGAVLSAILATAIHSG